MSSTKEKLQEASKGLWMMSESDYEFDHFEIEDQTIDDSLILELANKTTPTLIEKTTVDYIFRNMVKIVPAFVKLANELKNELIGLEVYRVGDIEVDVYIIGKADGKIQGLHTKLIET